MDDRQIQRKIEEAARTGAITLDLSNTPLSSVPATIGQLANLQELWLHNTQLSSVPATIGQLANLQTLWLHNTQLSSVPATIGQLANLQTLWLHNTPLSSVPATIGQLANLKKLDLSNTQLSSVPATIGQLANLQYLFLHETPLSLPPEILGPTWQEVRDQKKKPTDPQKIIRYYFQTLNRGTRPLNEAKMLLVGQGTVGKTSLVNRLLHNRFNPTEDKTDGINIQTWMIPRFIQLQPAIDLSQSEIQVNIWDFGGQEIMHATHQFFLTKRSLYLVVLDARTGEEENRLEYWLKLIDSFGDTSPVIIVGNKIDQHSLDLDRIGLQEKYLRIKAFMETSCQSGQGIAELREKIATEIRQLQHVGDRLPLSWFEIKTELENLEEDYVPYEKYVEFCKGNQVKEEENQKTLIEFLHDLGVVVNFQNDPRLADTNVLKPEWVTNGVYKILNDRPLIMDKRGILDLNYLPTVLNLKRYPTHKHHFLMNLMQKFELCFPLPDGQNRYLIPDLIPKERTYIGEWSDTLTFAYHYTVLPGSIFSRFMVRMHECIFENTYWRSGVVLAYEGCKALVQRDQEEKLVTIRLQGAFDNRRNFLGIIRQQFEAIHASFQGLEVVSKVVLPDYPDQSIEYQNLLKLEAGGHSTWLMPEIMSKIDIQELLDKLEPKAERQKRIINMHFYGSTEVDMAENTRKTKIDAEVVNYTEQNYGQVMGKVTTAINQLQSPEQTELKELLKKLQAAIDVDTSLSEEDKEDALEQVETIAQTSQNPTEGTLQKRGRQAIKLLKGATVGLPIATAFVKACNEFLPEISKLLGF